MTLPIGTVFQIQSITQGGFAKLAEYDNRGSLSDSTIKVEYDDLVRDYKKFEGSTVEMHPNWPGGACKDNAWLAKQSLRSQAVAAIAAITSVEQDPDVWITMKPKRAVFAEKDYPKGTLTLVPTTVKVSCVDEDTDCDAATVLGGTTLDGCKFVVETLTGDEAVAPFWLLQRSSEREDVNMEVQMKASTVKLTVGKRIVENKFLIPTLVNKVKLDKDDELVAYRTPKVTAVKRKADTLIPDAMPVSKSSSSGKKPWGAKHA